MQKIIKEIDSLSDIKFELNNNEVHKSIDPKNPKHYVNNRELYEELCAYHEKKIKALENGEEIPPLTNKIGYAIIQIATRRCNSWNFVDYTESWKQEMISNAIMVATIRGHNFDPTKSNNPFAYFTQICNNAILEQLKREKDALYVKYKQMDQIGFQASSLDSSDVNDHSYNDFNTDDENYYDSFDSDTDVSYNPLNDAAYADRMKYITDFETRIKEKKILKKQQKNANANLITLDN